jgi:hypothetical protein
MINRRAPHGLIMAPGRPVTVIELENDMSEIGRMAEELERYCHE